MVNDGPVTIILDSNQRDPVLKPPPKLPVPAAAADESSEPATGN